MGRLIGLRSALCGLAAVSMALTSTALTSTEAAAQNDDVAAPAATAGTVRLVTQNASVESEGTLDITVDWDGELAPDLFLSVLFHQRIQSERDVGTPTTNILNRRGPIPLDLVGTDPDGNLVISVPVRSVSSGDADRVYLPGPGVYPFTVEVRSTEGLISSVSSTVVRLPQDRSTLATLDFAVVLALSPADGLDLSDGLWFLSTYPEVPFTIQLDEGVLTQLESDPALAQQFAAAAAGRPVMSEAGIDLDPSALAEIEQGRFYTQAVAANAQRLIRLGLTPLPEAVMFSAQITPEGADLMASTGILAALSTLTNEIDTGAIVTPDSRIQVIQADRQLTAELSSPEGFSTFSPSDIYALYARLSLRAGQDQSSVILGGEGGANLDSQSLDTFLATLTEDGPLQPVSLIASLASQPRNPLQAAERPEQNLADSGNDIAELQRLAETSRSFRGVQNPGLEQLIVDSLSRTRNPADRSRAINRAKDELIEDFNSITLEGAQGVTLAAVEGPLPLTIRNDADGSRMVKLNFRGDRVTIEEAGEVIIIPPGETVLELTATARALGVSTLEVSATTPDDQRTLSISRYEIRSTAVPGLGWAIAGTALVFLLLWWIRSWRKPSNRRPHLIGLPSVSDADQPPTGPTIAADTAEAL